MGLPPRLVGRGGALCIRFSARPSRCSSPLLGLADWLGFAGNRDDGTATLPEGHHHLQDDGLLVLFDLAHQRVCLVEDDISNLPLEVRPCLSRDLGQHCGVRAAVLTLLLIVVSRFIVKPVNATHHAGVRFVLAPLGEDYVGAVRIPINVEVDRRNQGGQGSIATLGIFNREGKRQIDYHTIVEVLDVGLGDCGPKVGIGQGITGFAVIERNLDLVPFGFDDKGTTLDIGNDAFSERVHDLYILEHDPCYGGAATHTGKALEHGFEIPAVLNAVAVKVDRDDFMPRQAIAVGRD